MALMRSRPTTKKICYLGVFFVCFPSRNNRYDIFILTFFLEIGLFQYSWK